MLTQWSQNRFFPLGGIVVQGGITVQTFLLYFMMRALTGAQRANMRLLTTPYINS